MPVIVLDKMVVYFSGDAIVRVRIVYCTKFVLRYPQIRVMLACA